MLFDDLKNFVDIRPIRHWIEVRVRAHVFRGATSRIIDAVESAYSLPHKLISIPLSSNIMAYYNIFLIISFRLWRYAENIKFNKTIRLIRPRLSGRDDFRAKLFNESYNYTKQVNKVLIFE